MATMRSYKKRVHYGRTPRELFTFNLNFLSFIPSLPRLLLLALRSLKYRKNLMRSACTPLISLSGNFRIQRRRTECLQKCHCLFYFRRLPFVIVDNLRYLTSPELFKFLRRRHGKLMVAGLRCHYDDDASISKVLKLIYSPNRKIFCYIHTLRSTKLYYLFII